jgi:hypothetical protein
MLVKDALRLRNSSKFRMISSLKTVRLTDRHGKTPSGMVRAFCKRHRICVTWPVLFAINPPHDSGKPTGVAIDNGTRI